MADPTREPTDAVSPINPALLTALTTEHFTLQGARAATISESSSRSALYISAVASSLVALGFVAQVSKVGEAFQAFAFTVLPTLFVLGLFTWVRLTENGVEDLQYLRAINRIRGYYLKIEPESAHYFMMSAQEDAASMMASQGHAATLIEILFTFASMIAVINSVILGGLLTLAVASVFGAAPGVAIGAGGVSALGSILLHVRPKCGSSARFSFQPGQASGSRSGAALPANAVRGGSYSHENDRKRDSAANCGR